MQMMGNYLPPMKIIPVLRLRGLNGVEQGRVQGELVIMSSGTHNFPRPRQTGTGT